MIQLFGHNSFGARYAAPTPATPCGARSGQTHSCHFRKRPQRRRICTCRRRKRCSSKSSSTLRLLASVGATFQGCAGPTEDSKRNHYADNVAHARRTPSLAERLRREAESKHKLLTETKNVVQPDFPTVIVTSRAKVSCLGTIFHALAAVGVHPRPAQSAERSAGSLRALTFAIITEFGPRAVIYQRRVAPQHQ